MVDEGGLVVGGPEDVREAASGESGRCLGEPLGCADGGDEGAGRGEGGDKCGAGCFARACDAAISRGEEEGYASGPKLGVFVAQTPTRWRISNVH